MMALNKWVVCVGALAAAPDKAYAALLQPARWWSSEHTFSGSAAKLTLDARAGGCWCETLTDGGSVEHMRVVYVAPGRVLRLRGALGPLQGLGVEGAMTLSVKAGASGADITLSYMRPAVTSRTASTDFRKASITCSASSSSG
jgi:hypothetical protein